MSTAVLTNLLNYLCGTLSPSNMRWVGERLIEHANQEENDVKPYTMQEINDILAAAEENFKSGNYITNEEVMRMHAEMLKK